MGGSIGAAALAGCSGETPDASEETGVGAALNNSTGGTGNGTGRDSEGSDNGLVYQSLPLPGRYVPTELQWNSYAPSHFAQQGGKVAFDPFLRTNRMTGELIPYLRRDRTLDGTTPTVNPREGDQWHNGEPVIAEDVVSKFMIDTAFAYPVSDCLNGATAVDETTVEYEMAQAYHEDIITIELANAWMDTPTSEYGEFVDRYSEDMSDDELTTLRGDTQDYQPSEPVGSGPFRFGSANEQVLTLSKPHLSNPLALLPTSARVRSPSAASSLAPSLRPFGALPLGPPSRMRSSDIVSVRLRAGGPSTVDRSNPSRYDVRLDGKRCPLRTSPAGG